jgi:hypothetical protein
LSRSSRAFFEDPKQSSVASRLQQTSANEVG